MHKRKVLCLHPHGADLDVFTNLTPDWDVHLALLEAPPPLDDYPVGLIYLNDSRCESEPIEALLGDTLEWIALISPGILERPGLARLVANYCIDYHTLPVEPGYLRASLGHAHGMSALRRARTQQQVPTIYQRMVGTGPAMRELVTNLVKVAAVDAPVLIQGESGTGKELAAQAIHEASSRASGPFVAVNCGALPPGLIQSELFGHERGAFTGAQRRKIGRVEAAHGGTVLLDEIGDLSLELQVNLLRFLQEGVIERVGGGGPIAVNVRVIAATHVDLEAAMAAGRFRADLYYRLNVLRLQVPALRQRLEDIEPLAVHFFERFIRERGPGVRGFSQQAIEAMLRHDWPGNVRELLNRVRRGMVMCEGRLISPADLGLDGSGPAAPSLAAARSEAERTAVSRALMTTNHNVSHAAVLLGVSRVTLYRLIEKYGLHAVTERTDAAWRPQMAVNA